MIIVIRKPELSCWATSAFGACHNFGAAVDCRMALFGSVVTLRSQCLPADKFAAVFAYLDDLFHDASGPAARLRSIVVGDTQRIELTGGAFALEQVYRSKIRTEGFFESHRKYIDVQVVFDGEESMEVFDQSRAMIRHPYDPQRDLLVYEDRGGSVLHLSAGDAAVFHPTDIHMPGLCGLSGPALVRKTVIKVPVESR
jgi:YhcH/YjgK/YiaL family protein